MIEVLLAGGPVMVPIGLCSVIALAAFLERLWALRAGRVAPLGFGVEVGELVKQRRYADALTRCRSTGHPLARLLEVVLELRDAPREHIRDRVEEVGRREAAELERYVPVLGTVAAISPLLGLLGTVGGMIVTFDVIQDQGMGDVSRLAGGISQALVTTFAGLCVGIPALVANRYVLSRVDSLLLDLEEVVSTILELVLSQRGDEAAR